MKKTFTAVLTISAFIIGGMLVALPAVATSTPYLLATVDDTLEIIPTLPDVPSYTNLLQPSRIPAEYNKAPIESVVLKEGTPASASLQPTDCIDPDTYSNGQFFYYDPNHTPVTLTLCNKTYTRTADSYIIVSIHSNNITLDCNGATMVGNYDFDAPAPNYPYNKNAINAMTADNLTIKNCTIGGFGYGIFVGGGYNTTTHSPYAPTQLNIFNNTFTEGSYIDMVVSSAINSNIYNNTRAADTSNRGELPTVDLEFVSNSAIHDNTLLSNGGINLAFNSNNNQVYGNALGQFTADAASPYAIFLNHGSASNTIYSNTITGAEGQGIRFDGERDTDDYLNTGGAKLNDVYDNSLTNTTSALYFTADAYSNTVHDNAIADSTAGALMEGLLVNGSWVYPHDNTISNNELGGGLVLTDGAHDNTISNNTITNSTDAAILFYSYGGARGPATPIANNTLENNKIHGGCNNGFQFNAHASQNNTIHTNLIESCSGTGVNIETGNTGNSFYANSFVGNAIQVLNTAAGNLFDKDGQGNNWSDYDEEIEECLDDDQNGICDNPYFIAGTMGEYDHFPLTSMPVWGDNAPPVLSPVSDQTADEGHAFSLQLAGSDPDSPITYYTDAAAVLGSDFTFDANTGLFQWTPGWYQTGVYRINFGVTDGEYRDSDLVTITVINYYICGDANRDLRINLLDVSYIINYLYRHGLPPDPSLEVADANFDGRVNLLDVSYIINYLYRHGPLPPDHPSICHSPTATNTEFAN